MKLKTSSNNTGYQTHHRRETTARWHHIGFCGPRGNQPNPHRR
jgi:hypothetical protein